VLASLTFDDSVGSCWIAQRCHHACVLAEKVACSFDPGQLGDSRVEWRDVSMYPVGIVDVVYEGRVSMCVRNW
jgi:hypothetical protein